MGMTYGLIGCGTIAKQHVAAAFQNGLTITGLCDLVPENRERMLLEIPEALRGGVRLYSDYRTMLEAARPDLVAIATGSGVKTKIALQCIGAGSHLIIEKPLALSLGDADAIIRAAEERGVKVSTCHQNRLGGAVRNIRAALDEGRFGKLFHGAVHIRWNRGRAYYEAAKWRGTWSQDGGALMNQCIHSIDILRWLMGGEIDEVFAYTDRLNHDFIEAEDLGLALIRFKNGAYGIVEGTVNVYPKNLEETLYIFGETGTVAAGGKSLGVLEQWAFADEGDGGAKVKAQYGETPPDAPGRAHAPLYADMIEAIETGREPYVSAKDGREALELVLAVYQSAREGRPVKLPLSGGSAMDNAGRFDRPREIGKGIL